MAIFSISCLTLIERNAVEDSSGRTLNDDSEGEKFGLDEKVAGDLLAGDQLQAINFGLDAPLHQSFARLICALPEV